MHYFISVTLIRGPHSLASTEVRSDVYKESAAHTWFAICSVRPRLGGQLIRNSSFERLWTQSCSPELSNSTSTRHLSSVSLPTKLNNNGCGLWQRSGGAAWTPWWWLAKLPAASPPLLVMTTQKCCKTSDLSYSEMHFHLKTTNKMNEFNKWEVPNSLKSGLRRWP